MVACLAVCGVMAERSMSVTCNAYMSVTSNAYVSVTCDAYVSVTCNACVSVTFMAIQPSSCDSLIWPILATYR